MDDGRRQQWLIWKSWNPRQKLAAVGRMTATVLALQQAGIALRQRTTTTQDKPPEAVPNRNP